MRALTRMWQMLIKSLDEINIAPSPIMAAEMIIIRLTHAADLPPTDDLIKKIKSLRPETVLFGEHSSRVNNTILIALPNIPGDLSLMKLDLDGFAVSSGSACSSGKISESHVINAMNFKNLASNSIRISLPPNTKMLKRENLITTNELDRLAQCWSNL